MIATALALLWLAGVLLVLAFLGWASDQIDDAPAPSAPDFSAELAALLEADRDQRIIDVAEGEL